MEATPNPIYYYVDEAGDGVLFRSGGQDRLQDEDAPKFFILGMVLCPKPSEVAAALAGLQKFLRANPLYASISSFAKARSFHAKDDHAEIRSKVFDLIITLDFKIFAVVKDMRAVRDYVLGRNQMDFTYRYHPNELYDLTVRMLFKQRLHQAERCRITFARRGHADRTAALRQQLTKAQERFFKERPHASTTTSIDVLPAYPHEQPCLQLADYSLWAIQRCYEKAESRFLDALWPKVSLLHDVDDTSRAEYGAYFTRSGPGPDPYKIKDRWI